MAHVTKTSKQLKIVAGFEDGDDRTITVENPKSNVTAAQINELKDVAKYALIGDKADAAFTGWKDARIVESTTVYLDITPNA